MLSSAVKQHQAKQHARRDRQGFYHRSENVFLHVYFHFYSISCQIGIHYLRLFITLFYTFKHVLYILK